MARRSIPQLSERPPRRFARGDRSRRPHRLRKAVAALVAVAAAGAAAVSVQNVLADVPAPPPPWFAPYVDTTLTPLFPFEDPPRNSADDVVLGFVVGVPEVPCAPRWGGVYDLDAAATTLDLDRRITRYRANGGDVVVSFGGQAHRELALDCTDPTALVAAYRSVLERYAITVVDFDIEGEALADTAAHARRATAIKRLQDDARAGDGPGLAVWLTLPSGPGGLAADAVAVLDATLAAGVDLAGVNLMAMDYGSARPPEMTMVEAGTQGLTTAHRQLDGAYRRAGTTLNRHQLWAKLGLTPMIGQNDTPSDRLTLEDAADLLDFVRDHGLGRVSLWSINRDVACDDPALDLREVHTGCSSVSQPPLGFTALFDAFAGRPTDAAKAPTIADPDVDLPDDPTTSPYPIWRPAKSYVEGNKVVWHRVVYQAKWWTRDEAPNAPVVNEWDSPWRIVGPVLAGDRPPPSTTLAPGTHPAWAATVAYREGDRVLHAGLAYQARWATQGVAPDAEPAGPGDGPWKALAPLPGEELTAPVRN